MEYLHLTALLRNDNEKRNESLEKDLISVILQTSQVTLRVTNSGCRPTVLNSMNSHMTIHSNRVGKCVPSCNTQTLPEKLVNKCEMFEKISESLPLLSFLFKLRIKDFEEFLCFQLHT